MKRILVIADDLTGAAEIAGAGVRCGLPVRLLRHEIGTLSDGLTVVDVDSRSLKPEIAAQRHRDVLSSLSRGDFDLIYKKTDSALRGNIVAELRAMIDALGFREAILLPQNPSRGRTIRDGQYFIDGTPLHLTSFGHDPDHPAKTSDVRRLLGQSEPIHLLRPTEATSIEGISIAEAENPQDINSITTRICLDCLPRAG